MIFTCECGHVSVEHGEAPPPDCVGCLACQTSLNSHVQEIEPAPPVRVWRPLAPHTPRPVSDEEGAPRACNDCGQVVA